MTDQPLGQVNDILDAFYDQKEQLEAQGETVNKGTIVSLINEPFSGSILATITLS